MKGGEDSSDNCPPCPVCEERMKEEEPKPEKKGFFANLFGKSEDTLNKVQTDAAGFVAQSADNAKNKTKSLARGIMGPINNFIGPTEEPAQQMQNEAKVQPQVGGGRRRRTKHKKHSNKKHSNNKHLKKGTTKKRGLRKHTITKKRNLKRK